MPEVKVIILGMVDLTDEIMTCIEAGAAGYVLKEASFDSQSKKAKDQSIKAYIPENVDPAA